MVKVIHEKYTSPHVFQTFTSTPDRQLLFLTKYNSSDSFSSLLTVEIPSFVIRFKYTYE